MSPKNVLAATGATLAFAAAPAAAHHGHEHACDSFDHRGYNAFNIKAEHLSCALTRHFVGQVIVHGTGRFTEHGWLCFESSSTDGSGVAGCHKGEHRFSFSFRPV